MEFVLVCNGRGPRVRFRPLPFLFGVAPVVASVLALAYLATSALLEGRGAPVRARIAWRAAAALVLGAALLLPVASVGAERGLPIALGGYTVGAVAALVCATLAPRAHRFLTPASGAAALLAGLLS
jgi:hypothetical protein